MAKAKEKFLVFDDGERVKIVGSKGMYWVCADQCFKKNNPHIVDIVSESPVKKETKERGEENAVD